MEQRSPRRHHSTELARHSYLLQQTVFCIEEWEGAPTGEKLTLLNRGNRTPRREALSLLHRRYLQESPRRPKMKKSIAPKAVVHHANSGNAQRCLCASFNSTGSCVLKRLHYTHFIPNCLAVLPQHVGILRYHEATAHYP